MTKVPLFSFVHIPYPDPKPKKEQDQKEPEKKVYRIGEKEARGDLDRTVPVAGPERLQLSSRGWFPGQFRGQPTVEEGDSCMDPAT